MERSWDRYSPTPQRFYRGVQAVVLLFAVNDRSSFVELVEKWLQMIYDVRNHLCESVDYFLVGTKLDLGNRQVSKVETQVSR